MSKLGNDTPEELEEELGPKENDDVETGDKPSAESEQSGNTEGEEESFNGMRVLFGTNEQDGKPVLWTPNDTSQLFHTNTGIIGTMGTGKHSLQNQ